MLTQLFDQQTERYLSEILAQEKISSDELLKTLIHDRWQSLQTELPNVPKRKHSKQTIAEFVRKKNSRPV
jgi:hypothetical protein